MHDTPTRTVTETEAARYIGMSRSWLAQARMNRNGDAPPFLKIGRSVRYLIDDLDNWLDSRRLGTLKVDETNTGDGA